MNRHHSTRTLVRKAYARAASAAASRCYGYSCGYDAPAPVKSEGELGLSCGNPVAFSKIKKGMTVLDLGSGAGRDAFIAAPLCGPDGKVIGVDMTPEMLKLAVKNLAEFTARTGLANVEFRRGLIEKLPVKDEEADLIISNCVINLSPDKPAVFREAYRALKPGGAMVISDIVLNRKLPQSLKKHAGLYASCAAGALQRQDYLCAIKAAGFDDIKLLSDRLYTASCIFCDPITGNAANALEGCASSITVYSVKTNKGGKK